MEIEIFEKIKFIDCKDKDICSICLEKKDSSELVYSCKRCYKNFHEKCIDELLKYKHKCPYCRYCVNEDENYFDMVNFNLNDYELLGLSMNIVTYYEMSMTIELFLKVFNILINIGYLIFYIFILGITFFVLKG